MNVAKNIGLIMMYSLLSRCCEKAAILHKYHIYFNAWVDLSLVTIYE